MNTLITDRKQKKACLYPLKASSHED